MSLARFPVNDAALRLLSALLLLAIWQAASLSGSALLPGPASVLRAMIDDATEGYLLSDLGYTLARVVASFVLAMAVGSAIGMLMGRSRPVDGLFDLWLVLGLNVPALVIIILCYLWIGLNETAAITAVALNKVAQTAVILREGARSVDPHLLQVADVLRLPWGRRMRRAYLPQLYPYFMAATRTGLSLIWKIVLVAELIGRSNGVGFRLGLYFQFFDIANILAYSASFIAIVLAIEGFVVRPLERRLTRWRA
ncbi:MAG TPA: ABC transporter permease [Stellaceae bacterium]|nr:ABC transporter permease [Stellaceae bacterium]